MTRSLSLLTFFLFIGCTKPTPPAPTPPHTARLTELLATLSQQNDEHPGHGTYHRARNELERELWTIVSTLPVVDGGDALLFKAIFQVYTRYDQNYLHGYLWHWPYLSSRRAIRLADKLLIEYPRSPLRERTLWLKAFALRCPPTQPHPQAEADLDVYRDQLTWLPDVEKARTIYQHIASMDGLLSRSARHLAESPSLGLILPVGPLEPDPRASEADR